MLRLEMGLDDGLGPAPVESPGPRPARPDGLVLARGDLEATDPPDGCRLCRADDPSGPPLVPRPGDRLGARWRLCGGEVGPHLPASPRRADLPLAVGCGLVRSPPGAGPGEAGSQAQEGGPAAQAHRVGRPGGHAVGGARTGVVRWPTQAAAAVLP